MNNKSEMDKKKLCLAPPTNSREKKKNSLKGVQVEPKCWGKS